MGLWEVLRFTQNYNLEVCVKCGVEISWNVHYNVITKQEG